MDAKGQGRSCRASLIHPEAVAADYWPNHPRQRLSYPYVECGDAEHGPNHTGEAMVPENDGVAVDILVEWYGGL